jgi:hypothetical protein
MGICRLRTTEQIGFQPVAGKGSGELVSDGIAGHAFRFSRRTRATSCSRSEKQREVLTSLQEASTYGHREMVSHIDTQGATVFLAGPDVYKVKPTVRYPYMDLYGFLHVGKAALSLRGRDCRQPC